MKRMLFVDDEPMILQGLRRMLYQMRDQWECEYASSGDEALSFLKSSDFDVVITDMRMPGMDGATLLSEVSTTYPNVIRIILSGEADEEAILRSAGKTHLFLSKPCEPDVLKSALLRVCGLSDLLNQDNLKRVVAQMKTLPSIPQTYAELIQELRSEDPSIRKVAHIVSKDVSMMARILHLANSAYFIGRQTFTNPTDAILRLGLRSIEGLVLYAHIFTKFDTATAKSFNIDDVMDHSVHVGRLARIIAHAERLSPKAADDAFSAGLMHDVGVLMLAANLPRHYNEARRLAEQEGLTNYQAEMEVFGTTHAALGAYLMRLWGLSDNVTETIAFHNSPSQASHTQLGPLTIVHAADALEYEVNQRKCTGLPAQIDLEYLESLALADHVNSWREACIESNQER